VTTIVIATRNAHKVGEIRAILGGAAQILTLNDFPNVPKVIEDADTFAGNARKKAVELARWLAVTFPLTRHSSPLFVLADDSGLEVDALDGAPGVHSARFAALDSAKSGNTPDADNNTKLLRLLKDIPPEKRRARFHCAIALVEVHSLKPTVQSLKSKVQSPHLFDGSCEGRIGFAPRGKNGFGYDPLFVPVGLEKTFAELGEDMKNKLSHRARALEKLKAYISKLPGGS
jgi:XTP/dITP diphosphohydrolase